MDVFGYKTIDEVGEANTSNEKVRFNNGPKEGSSTAVEEIEKLKKLLSSFDEGDESKNHSNDTDKPGLQAPLSESNINNDKIKSNVLKNFSNNSINSILSFDKQNSKCKNVFNEHNSKISSSSIEIDDLNSNSNRVLDSLKSDTKRKDRTKDQANSGIEFRCQVQYDCDDYVSLSINCDKKLCNNETSSSLEIVPCPENPCGALKKKNPNKISETSKTFLNKDVPSETDPIQPQNSDEVLKVNPKRSVSSKLKVLKTSVPMVRFKVKKRKLFSRDEIETAIAMGCYCKVVNMLDFGSLSGKIPTVLLKRHNVAPYNKNQLKQNPKLGSLSCTKQKRKYTKRTKTNKPKTKTNCDQSPEKKTKNVLEEDEGESLKQWDDFDSYIESDDTFIEADFLGFEPAIIPSVPTELSSNITHFSISDSDSDVDISNCLAMIDSSIREIDQLPSTKISDDIKQKKTIKDKKEDQVIKQVKSDKIKNTHQHAYTCTVVLENIYKNKKYKRLIKDQLRYIKKSRQQSTSRKQQKIKSPSYDDFIRNFDNKHQSNTPKKLEQRKSQEDISKLRKHLVDNVFQGKAIDEKSPRKHKKHKQKKDKKRKDNSDLVESSSSVCQNSSMKSSSQIEMSNDTNDVKSLRALRISKTKDKKSVDTQESASLEDAKSLVEPNTPKVLSQTHSIMQNEEICNKDNDVDDSSLVKNCHSSRKVDCKSNSHKDNLIQRQEKNSVRDAVQFAATPRSTEHSQNTDNSQISNTYIDQPKDQSIISKNIEPVTLNKSMPQETVSTKSCEKKLDFEGIKDRNCSKQPMLTDNINNSAGRFQSDCGMSDTDQLSSLHLKALEKSHVKGKNKHSSEDVKKGSLPRPTFKSSEDMQKSRKHDKSFKSLNSYEVREKYSTEKLKRKATTEKIVEQLSKESSKTNTPLFASSASTNFRIPKKKHVPQSPSPVKSKSLISRRTTDVQRGYQRKQSNRESGYTSSHKSYDDKRYDKTYKPHGELWHSSRHGHNYQDKAQESIVTSLKEDAHKYSSESKLLEPPNLNQSSQSLQESIVSSTPCTFNIGNTSSQIDSTEKESCEITSSTSIEPSQETDYADETFDAADSSPEVNKSEEKESPKDIADIATDHYKAAKEKLYAKIKSLGKYRRYSIYLDHKRRYIDARKSLAEERGTVKTNPVKRTKYNEFHFQRKLYNDLKIFLTSCKKERKREIKTKSIEADDDAPYSPGAPVDEVFESSPKTRVEEQLDSAPYSPTMIMETDSILNSPVSVKKPETVPGSPARDVDKDSSEKTNVPDVMKIGENYDEPYSPGEEWPVSLDKSDSSSESDLESDANFMSQFGIDKGDFSVDYRKSWSTSCLTDSNSPSVDCKSIQNPPTMSEMFEAFFPHDNETNEKTMTELLQESFIAEDVPYFTKTPLGQSIIDKAADIPVAGLQYILEVQKDESVLEKCSYICTICSKKMSPDTLLAHVKSVPHRLKYVAVHNLILHEEFGKLELKQWTPALVKKFTASLMDMEKANGRKQMAVVKDKEVPHAISYMKDQIANFTATLQEKPVPLRSVNAETVSLTPKPTKPLDSSIEKTKHHSPAATKSTDQSTRRSKNGSLKNGTSFRESVDKSFNGKRSLKSERSPRSHRSRSPGSLHRSRSPRSLHRSRSPRSLHRSRSPKSLRRSRSPRNRSGGSRSHRRSRSPRSIRKSRSPRHHRSRSPRMPRGRTPPMFSRESGSPRPLFEKQDFPRSQSPRRPQYSPRSVESFKRSGSPSSYLRNRSPDIGRRFSRDRGPRFTETPQRSFARNSSPLMRHRSPMSRSPSRYSMQTPVSEAKMSQYLAEKSQLELAHSQKLEEFLSVPESHPFYQLEWTMFWERERQELIKCGIDPSRHDFKDDWTKFWRDRLVVLCREEHEAKLKALALRYTESSREDIDIPMEKSPRSPKPNFSRKNRSPSPWEDSKDSKDKDVLIEPEFSVSGTLRMLTHLENQLGSLGNSVSVLLLEVDKAVRFGGNAIDMFKEKDNKILLKLCQDKLRSLIASGVLSPTTVSNTYKAIEACDWLQNEIDKTFVDKPIKNIGLDIDKAANETLGMNAIEIASYIAQELVRLGLSDAGENELQSILAAVSASHTRMAAQASAVADEISRIGNITEEFSSKPAALFPSAKTTEPSDEKPSFGLGMLQTAYEEEPQKEMDDLSMDELLDMLINFTKLTPEVQQELTGFLKKLEATDSKKVTMLRTMVQQKKPRRKKSMSTSSTASESQASASSTASPVPEKSFTKSQANNPSRSNTTPANRAPPPLHMTYSNTIQTPVAHTMTPSNSAPPPVSYNMTSVDTASSPLSYNRTSANTALPPVSYDVSSSNIAPTPVSHMEPLNRAPPPVSYAMTPSSGGPPHAPYATMSPDTAQPPISYMTSSKNAPPPLSHNMPSTNRELPPVQKSEEFVPFQHNEPPTQLYDGPPRFSGPRFQRAPMRGPSPRQNMDRRLPGPNQNTRPPFQGPRHQTFHGRPRNPQPRFDQHGPRRGFSGRGSYNRFPGGWGNN